MALPASGLAGQATPPAARLTGRGAVLGMAVVFTVGLLVASWLDVTVLAGILFVLGCALAAWFTRPADLLIVVLTPPILFSGALIFAEAVTASGSLFLSVAAGSVVTLASLAFWLAAGLVVTVAIALPRGLLKCVGELLRDLRADLARLRAHWVARAARPGGLRRNPLLRPARPGAARPAGPARPGSPGARRPGGTKAARPAPRGGGTIKAGGAASRSPGHTKTAAPASGAPGSTNGRYARDGDAPGRTQGAR